MGDGICCKCGKKSRPDQRYCNSCHAEWMRLYRPKHSELKEESRKKANARSYLHVYVKRGKVLKVENCEICGALNTEAHHEDHSQPLSVNWICRKCHLDLHKMQELNIDKAKKILVKGTIEKEPIKA